MARPKRLNIPKDNVVSDLDDILGAVKKDIQKQFDINTAVENASLSFLSTGNPAVNYAISGKVDGGFPVGWMTELAGLNATGKSLLAQHALVETQKLDGVAILVDSEFAFNPDWYRTLGGDPERLIHYEPDYIEQAYQFMDDTVQAVRAKSKDVPITIVYDSIAASPSKYEYEGDQEKFDMGKRAIAHGKGCRLLMGLTKKQNVTFISINQYRKTMAMFGPDMTTTGGMGWDYACSVRIGMKKGKVITTKRQGVGDVPIGIHGSLKVNKNRCRAPFAEANFDIFWDGGIDPTSGLMDVLIAEGVIEPAGQGWWLYKEKKFQKGKVNEILEEFPELLGGHETFETPDEVEYQDSDKSGEKDNDADM
jgi:recombination protein RecA